MDYTPPPELTPQFAFVTAVRDHFFWRGLKGEFAPAFTRTDLLLLDEQAATRGEACLRQLKAAGICRFEGLKAENGDVVTMLLDRNCAVSARQGEVTARSAFAVPADIGKLLPVPEKPAKGLECNPEGVILHEKKPALKPTSFWYEVAGRRMALSPAIPSVPPVRLV